jgi:hypothetical protein
MAGDRAVTATFNLRQHELRMTGAGDGSGTAICTAGGVARACAPTQTYAHGTQVTITVDAAESSVFSGWSGACATAGTGAGTDTGTCTVTMNAPVDVTATFMLRRFRVTAAPVSGNGAVAVACGVPPAPCDVAQIPYGTRVTVTATPASGFIALGWGPAPGACVPQSLTECAIASIVSDALVSAFFGVPGVVAAPVE